MLTVLLFFWWKCYFHIFILIQPPDFQISSYLWQAPKIALRPLQAHKIHLRNYLFFALATLTLSTRLAHFAPKITPSSQCHNSVKSGHTDVTYVLLQSRLPVIEVSPMSSLMAIHSLRDHIEKHAPCNFGSFLTIITCRLFPQCQS